MMRTLYKVVFWLLVSGVSIVALNSVYPTFTITSLVYYLAFIVSIGLSLGILVPFLLDFFTIRKHLYNLIFASSLIVWAIVWVFNDLVPHFHLVETSFTIPVVFSIVLSSISQGIYKIAKKL